MAKEQSSPKAPSLAPSNEFDHLTNEEKAERIIEEMYDVSTTMKSLYLKYNITPYRFRKTLSRTSLLADKYDCARTDKADMIVDEIVEIADTDPDPQRARNRIDARKWFSSKLKPKQYGDRIDVNLNETPSIRSAMEAANSRLQNLATLLPMSYPKLVGQDQGPETIDVVPSESAGHKPANEAQAADPEQDPKEIMAHDIFD